MKIVIATGIYPPEIGGPSEYARQLLDTLLVQDHDAKVVTYGDLKNLPTGFRHFMYFCRLITEAHDTQYLITLDAFSVGLPALLFAKLFRKKIVVRMAGDFLWESYVNRRRESVLLSEFYTKERRFTQKEKMILKLSRFVLNSADSVVFSTEWQREIMQKPYHLNMGKTCIIENFYPKVKENSISKISKRIFLSPSRDIYLKNKKRLEEAFAMVSKNNPDIILDTKVVSHEVLMEKIPESYAIIVTSLSEVSPNLILDALQYSVPTIVTKDTGIASRLKDLSVFVNPLSVLEISKGIENILDNNVYNQYKTRIMQNQFTHSWNEIAQEYLDLYKRI